MQSSSLPPSELSVLDPVVFGITLLITPMSWIVSAGLVSISKFKSLMREKSEENEEVTHANASNITANTSLRRPPEPDDTKQQREAERATLLEWLNKCSRLVTTNKTISPTDEFESRWRALSRKDDADNDQDHRKSQDTADDSTNDKERIDAETIDEHEEPQFVEIGDKASQNQSDIVNTGQAGAHRVETDAHHDKGKTSDEVDPDQNGTSDELLDAHHVRSADDQPTLPDAVSPTTNRDIVTDEASTALSTTSAISQTPKLSITIPPSPTSLSDSPRSTLSPPWLSSVMFDFMLFTVAENPQGCTLAGRTECAHLSELTNTYHAHKITFATATKLVISLRSATETIEEAHAHVNVGNEVMEHLEGAFILARHAAEKEMKEMEKICGEAERMRWGHAIRCITCYRRIAVLMGDLRDRKREL